MLGIEITALFRFFIQLNLVLAGAAALWAFVFAGKAKKEQNREKKKSWHLLIHGSGFVFFPSLLAFIASWWVGYLFVFSPQAAAHEGVAHSAVFPHTLTIQGFEANFIFVSLITILALPALRMFLKDKEYRFENKSSLIFGTFFILLSIILSLSTWAKELSWDQLAYTLHNWHSIITLGTVIMVDFLYLYTVKKDKLKHVLYRFYPKMSAAIWFGLGLDFISSFILLSESGFPSTEQFVFNQTVVAILVINGALLSVRTNDKMISLLNPDGTVSELNETWDNTIRISGSVSFASWVTITFIDFFSIELSYWPLLFGYLAFIAILYATKPMAEKTISSVCDKLDDATLPADTLPATSA